MTRRTGSPLGGGVAVTFEKDDGGYDDFDEQDAPFDEKREEEEEVEEQKEREEREAERLYRTGGCAQGRVPCPFPNAVARQAASDAPWDGVVRFDGIPSGLRVLRVTIEGEFDAVRSIDFRGASVAYVVDGVWLRIRGRLVRPAPNTCGGFDDADRRIPLHLGRRIRPTPAGHFVDVVTVPVPSDLVGVAVTVTFPGLAAAGNEVRYTVGADALSMDAPTPEARGTYCSPA